MKSIISFGSIEKLAPTISKRGDKLRMEIMMPIPTSIIVYGIFILDEKNAAANTVPRNIGMRYSDASTICGFSAATEEGGPTSANAIIFPNAGKCMTLLSSGGNNKSFQRK
jgi:hypothetical protein